MIESFLILGQLAEAHTHQHKVAIADINWAHPLWDAYAILIGACFGSFLNVCIYRIPMELSLSKPGSHCFSCKAPIRWFHNIPIFSYLALGGKCASCKAKYSSRYMLIELLTAFLFWAVWHFYGYSWHTPVYWLVVAALIAGTFIDIDHLILPDRITWGGIIAGLIISPFYPGLHQMETWKEGLIASVAGAGLGFGLLWTVSILGTLAFKKDAMGFGDVKLIGAIGAFLGWRAVIFTIVASSFIGTFGGIITMIIQRKGKWGVQIPYGPYLAAAAVLWIFYGQAIWTWYFGLLLR